MALLDVRGITKIYGEGEVSTIALRGVSFSVEKGEFVSIMGPSGSGKSTLLHILGLLDRSSSGSYIFDGQDTASLSDERRAAIRNGSMGFVFQAYHLLPRATVLENVILPLYYSSIPAHEYQERAEHALQEVAMEHRLRHLPNQLSGGEKQRTAIARALVNEPQIIFADEPTGNLDSTTGQAVMETIDRLHKRGHTVVLITHESTAAAYAERIITMRDGKIVSDAASNHIHKHYAK